MADQVKYLDQIKTNLQNAPLAEQKAQQAVSLLNQGRSQYATASKFEDISDILSKADGDPNRIKAGLTRFLNNPDNTQVWTDVEKQALKDAASGTGTEKLLKMFGKFGFDLGKGLTMGNTIGPVVGAAVTHGPVAPIVGTAARIGQTLSARGAAEKLLKTISSGGQGTIKATPMSGLLSAPAANIAQQIDSKTGQISQQASPQLSMPQSQTIAAPSQPMSYETTTKEPVNTAMRDQLSPLLDKIQKAESGNNPNAQNPQSSASGAFQFTNGTWAQMVKKYGQQTGITMQDKTNPQAQAVMARFLAQDNIKSLQKNLGRMPTKGELYQAHVLGAHGAAQLIRAVQSTPNRQAIMLFPKAVTGANHDLFFNGNTPKTVQQLYSTLSQKVA